MQGSTEASERLVCAVLAAQVAAMRDRSDIEALLDLVWRAIETLATLSHLVTSLAARVPGLGDSLLDQSSTGVADAAAMRASLEALAFLETQRHDFGRQVADCVVRALESLAASDPPPGGRLTPRALCDLYVCEEQRRVHDSAIGRLACGR
nr:hypothetical protein [uncultured Lichenicoccus sp.]